MAVHRTKAGARILLVLETVAREQPIGVSDIARLLGEDKSTVQRMLMTLSDAGWITAVGDNKTRWTTSSRVTTLARYAQRGNDLRQRAQLALQQLRDTTGETAALTMLDQDQFTVVELAESTQMLRIAPHIGQRITIKGSVSGLAFLPFVSEKLQRELLGEEPSASLRATYKRVIRDGYATFDNPKAGGSINFAAPVFGVDDRPVAVVVLSAPSGRIGPGRYAATAALVMAVARELSSGGPPPLVI